MTIDRRLAFAHRCQLVGWALFIVSALFFIASSIRNGDLPGLFGGLFFLVACVAFLLPYFRHRWPAHADE